MATCRSCPAKIDWAKLPNGKAIPVDRASADDPAGNLAVSRQEDGRLAARYLKGREDPGPGEHRGISHFAACPNARQHRRREAPGG
jgi:hypothetical protein